MKTGLRAATSSLVGLIVFGFVLFYPAGTFNYWQAWAFIAVFSVVTSVPSIYLARTNPAVLARRMRAGPRAETRTVQKFVVTGTFLAFLAMMALSALDRRYGWSSAPAVVSLIGDVLVAIGLGIAMLVVIQNDYAASNVTVEAGQTVVSTGLYGLVRHPMYCGSVILMLGIPPALGSYWGLVVFLPGVVLLVFRILDEEKLLTQELSGYREYRQRVRYRLVPHIW